MSSGFGCPAYWTQRDALADQVCKLATPGARKAMEGVRRRGREEGMLVEEACVMNWLMKGGALETRPPFKLLNFLTYSIKNT